MNQLQFIGNVGRDPEMRFTPSGQAVTNFSVAVSKKYTAKSGEKVSKTTWIRVSVWGNLAEICQQYVTKGMKVFVSGELTADDQGNPRIWQKSDGGYAASFEMTAHNVEFLSKPESGALETAQELGGVELPVEDDIPF
jgi:single-strand DNA-binding protein